MHRWLLWLFFLLPSSSLSQNVMINEILASNQTIIDDEDGNTSDSIEHFNSGSEPVQLQGYGLRDDPPVRRGSLTSCSYGRIIQIPSTPLPG